jgi:proteasome lid subunit RPN8/RPN11
MRCVRRAAAKAWRRSASAAAWASRWSSRFRLPDVRIDREALITIVAHAKRAAPHECCGLLVGRPADGPADAGPHVLEAIPASNGASDPARRYEISPVDYFAQLRRCRTINAAQHERFAVIGAYHSHPRRGPEPSETDTAQAFRDFVFVIVGLGDGAGMQIRAYTLEGGALAPIELTVVE